MKVKDGQIIISQKDVDKGLNITSTHIEKAIKQRKEKLSKEARLYGWP